MRRGYCKGRDGSYTTREVCRNACAQSNTEDADDTKISLAFSPIWFESRVPAQRCNADPKAVLAAPKSIAITIASGRLRNRDRAGARRTASTNLASDLSGTNVS